MGTKIARDRFFPLIVSSQTEIVQPHGVRNDQSYPSKLPIKYAGSSVYVICCGSKQVKPYAAQREANASSPPNKTDYKQNILYSAMPHFFRLDTSAVRPALEAVQKRLKEINIALSSLFQKINNDNNKKCANMQKKKSLIAAATGHECHINMPLLVAAFLPPNPPPYL